MEVRKEMKMQTKSKFGLLIVTASTLLLSACTSSYNKPASAAETAAAARSVAVLNGAAPAQTTAPAYNRKAVRAPTAASNLIIANDTLDINVFKVADLSSKAQIVQPSGSISLPLIGSVKVAGLSINQAENTIAQRLKKYMQDPKVSITRTNKAVENRVTVEGEVKAPGVFPIKGNLSFLQAIAMAQGLSDIAESRNVLFYRDGARHSVNLDLVRLGKIPDPVLRGDDRIIVLKNPAKVREKKVIDYLPAVTAPISILRGL
ncbi:MAG TPA: polysaccharide export protein [Leucothrix sp.]|nr:polysaccharide export protein [Leucothrix sp.]